MTINEFRGEYRFLSNFYEYPLFYNGKQYLSAEAAFQAQKCTERADEFTRLNPSDAKRHGRCVTLREDWEDVKDAIMTEVVTTKFIGSRELRKQLLDTEDAVLVEGNRWHDNYWGYCTCSKCALKTKKNKLGTILMKVRDDLRSMYDS